MKTKMEFNDSLEVISKRHGLGEGGYVQAWLDNECIKQMAPFTPFRTGMLVKSATVSNTIGGGVIKQHTPYARFQYYGKVMTTEDGRVWAKLHEKKPVVTERNLVHNTAKHPLAGPFWFQRMKEAKKDALLRGAQELIRRGRT